MVLQADVSRVRYLRKKKKDNKKISFQLFRRSIFIVSLKKKDKRKEAEQVDGRKTSIVYAPFVRSAVSICHLKID